jgi:hypothetical protein
VKLLWAVSPAGTPRAVVWTFDRLDRIGGFPTIVLGHPQIVRTPLGKAVEFNGVDAAIFIDNHPLAGAETFRSKSSSGRIGEARPSSDGFICPRWIQKQVRIPTRGSCSRSV